MKSSAISDPLQAKKAVIYLRVSTEEQVENFSLGTQEEICRKEAARRGYEIIEVFREEGRSAKNIFGRPVLLELLEYCRRNKHRIQGVFIYRLDRISRQTSDYLAIRKKLAEHGIALISATEPTGNSPTEKLIETMLAGFAQLDNDIRSERAKNGLRARFLSGLMSGKPPLGYTCQNGYVIKDEETFEKVKKAWELMGTGTKNLREIATLMNEWGLREKHGKQYKLRPQTANRIFRLKFYMGMITSPTYAEEVRGQHPPMISEELYYRVQAILDGRNPNIMALSRRNRDNPEFPLRRITKCCFCQSGLTAAWSKGKRKQYAYYFCVNRCQKASIPIKEINEAVLNYLEEITPRPEVLALFTTLLRKTYYQRLASLQKRKDQSDEELKKLYELRQALIEKNLLGVYSDEIFREQNKLIEERVVAAQAAKSDVLLTKYNLEDLITFIKKKFSNLGQTYLDSNLAQKKVVLCSIFPAGMLWSYPGYSNTEMSPYYQSILQPKAHQDALGAG